MMLHKKEPDKQQQQKKKKNQTWSFWYGEKLVPIIWDMKTCDQCGVNDRNVDKTCALPE